MPVLTNPHFTQNADRIARFLGLTTALPSFHTWETHLQDASHSILVLIHKDSINFLLFLHSHFASTNGRGLSAGAKDAKTAKIPVGTSMTSEDCICCHTLQCRSL